MFTPQNSLLLVIDIQGRLAHTMHQKEILFKNVNGLCKAAQILDIPIIYTEQVPDKIGSTIDEIKLHLGNAPLYIKKTFSCYGEETFVTALKKSKRKQIIVCGIEAHVCVTQTVIDLLDAKYCVQIVIDAISSRSHMNSDVAFKRMLMAGAVPATTEMLLTELLRTSAHPKFRDILSLIK